MGEEGTNHKFYMILDNELVEVPTPVTMGYRSNEEIEKLALQTRIERLESMIRARDKRIQDQENYRRYLDCEMEKASRSLETTRVWLDYYKRKPGWFMGPIAYLAWLVTRPRDVPRSDDR